MSTVTPLLNLVKPINVEQFSLALYNSNLDIIDSKSVIIESANSSYNAAGWDLTNCRFTRMRVGLVGIIIAELVVTLNTPVFPANTAAPTTMANAVPVGYAPIAGPSLPLQSINTANNGTGSALQAGWKSDKSFNIRSAGAGFTGVAGSTIYWSTAYKWDGSLT